MDAYGHDQHVLNIHWIDAGATPATAETTVVSLDTVSEYTYRGELRLATGRWTWGLDVSLFHTRQDTADRSAAGDGSGREVVFEVAGRSFSSTSPGQVLLYSVLEDTALETWTADIYGLRRLSSGEQGDLQLQLGLRNADFDNDYRAVVGVEDVGGRRLDASSNYDRMMGPLVGLLATVDHGRNRFEGYLGQSVLFGSVELTSTARDFTGPLSAAFPVEAEIETTTSRERLWTEQDVAIPVSE
jgi:hypothetical protein